MFTPTVMTTVYVLLGLAVAALVVLLISKRLRNRPRPAAPPAPAAPVFPPGEAGPVSWSERRLFARETASGPESAVPAVEPDEVPSDESGDYVVGGLTPAVAAMMPESEDGRRQWKRDLRTAGYLSPRAWQNFAAVRYLCIIVPLVALGVSMLLVPPQAEVYVAIALLVVPLLGWALPALHVRARMRERVTAIERGMPDLVDMLNMCVSQGLTVLASLRRIRRQIADPHPALATELGIVVEQAEIGTLRQALENFAARIDVPEVHSLVNLLVQTDRMGTSVSVALKDYSDGVRESLRQRADEKANRASFRLLFPTVLCLMPAVYLILLGPAVNEMVKFSTSEDGGRALIEESRQTLQGLDRPSQVER